MFFIVVFSWGQTKKIIFFFSAVYWGGVGPELDQETCLCRAHLDEFANFWLIQIAYIFQFPTFSDVSLFLISYFLWFPTFLISYFLIFLLFLIS